MSTKMLTFAFEGPLPNANGNGRTDKEDHKRGQQRSKRFIINRWKRTGDGSINHLALTHYFDFGLNEPEKDELNADDEVSK